MHTCNKESHKVIYHILETIVLMSQLSSGVDDVGQRVSWYLVTSLDCCKPVLNALLTEAT